MGRTEHPNQFALLSQRRFAPFFWTQFSGAANDNLFKFAFTVMVTYQLQLAWLPPDLAGLVIGALFILPFLLFSATSGQLADKYDKKTLIVFVKRLEIGIMALAAWGFFSAQIPLLLLCTFLMGVHSTVFGPVKFAYLPQMLNERELTGGNGMVEMGTFVAILLGNVAGGLIISVPGLGPVYVGVTCLALAIVGRVMAREIPASPATDPQLKINWNPVTETFRNLKLAREDAVVFRSLLGISWMWFFGAVFLSQFPSFARDVLHGDEHVASLLLVVFSVGIGVGSLLCEVFSRHRIETGLVPMGAIGMSVFSIDLYFSSRGLPPASQLGTQAFLEIGVHWRVLIDLALLSLSAGLYSVPMYALIQLRSRPTHRARVIAANNILNALFMIGSSVIAGALLASGFGIPQIFLFTGLANVLVAGFIFLLVPEYLLRFFSWVTSRCIYRLRVRGMAHIPARGAALLVCNRLTHLDVFLLMAASPRHILFLLDHPVRGLPLMGWVLRSAHAISVRAGAGESKAKVLQVCETAADRLAEGHLVCIFPEGGATRNGGMHEDKSEVMGILELTKAQGHQVSVIPMALTRPPTFYSRQVDLSAGAAVEVVGINHEFLSNAFEDLTHQRGV